MEQILDVVRGFDGVLELAPEAGSEHPEIAWGDHFFYYAPDGQVPQRGQPYATIVTKNYPDDAQSDLDRPGRWRLNVHVGTAGTVELLCADATTAEHRTAFSAEDALLPHPLYARQGWISIVNPGPRTSATAIDLLHRAHEAARTRADRRRPLRG